MNKIVLVCSNLYSGSENIVKSLTSGSRVQRVDQEYSNTGVLFNKIAFKEYGKKPIYYLDHLLYNHQFSNKVLLKHCFFIFLIGEPRVCISNMVSEGFTQKHACNYYLLRIRKIYEMIKKSTNKITLFPEDLSNRNLYNFIHEKLHIKDRIKPKFNTILKKDLSLNLEIITESEDFYEKYRYIIKKENHEYQF